MTPKSLHQTTADADHGPPLVTVNSQFE